ncbi:MAG: carbohydrate kinase [Deltaproteobacteria bacterium]|nr:MAG: carbohydrate kinase [Deltaproteobacteria bacterium]
MSILVVGHYSHDTLLTPAGERRVLGGSAAYASAILEALEVPHEVVAKVGPDFLYAAQVSRGPIVIPTARTTSFIDDYRSGERVGRVEAACQPILPSDLIGQHEVGMACAIAGELPLATLQRLHQISRIVVADAQAVMREIGPRGELRLRPPEATALEHIHYLKASGAEAQLLDLSALRRRLTLLVTHGARGATLLSPGEEVHIPAFPAEEIDPTGAGDCFLAGFAVGIARGLDPSQAARIGAWCGARAVEQVGVPRLTPAQAIAAIDVARRA